MNLGKYKMVEALAYKNERNLLNEVKKNISLPISSVIDGKTDACDIAEVFALKYES